MPKLLSKTKGRPSLQSWKQRKRRNAKSEHNVRQAGFYSVTCDVHGQKRAQPHNQALWVFGVGAPKNKRHGLSGCPHCKD